MAEIFSLSNSTQHSCERMYREPGQNETHMFNVPNPYEGIPENLIINAASWAVLLILFALLRRKAWNYGRMALVHRDEERQTLHGSDSRYNVWTTLFYGTETEDTQTVQGSTLSLDASVKFSDRGFFSWIGTCFKIKDEDYLRKCGIDAVQYLSFQRYLLVYLGAVTLLSIAVVLPVNFQGTLEGDKESFGHTTISNLEAGSPLLWLHALLCLVYGLLLLLLVAHFARSLQFDREEHVSRTLMISRVPQTRCFKNSLLQHFREAYPDVTVTDVQFAHDIGKLIQLDERRQRALEARLQSELQWSRSGVRPTLVPRTCGRPCACCCRQQEVDCIDHYGAEEASLREQCEREKAEAFQRALGFVFITFQTELMAAKVMADFRVGCRNPAQAGASSSLSHELRVDRWLVRFSPAPDNIYWENLASTPARWWIKAVLVNLFLIVLLIFFSTPTVIMNTLDELFWRKAKAKAHSSLVVHFLPTLLLWTFSSLLPNIVYYTDRIIGHYTRTTEHHTVMRKTFVFLLLMVLILPSLGLTSVMALFLNSTKPVGDQELQWKCMFLPDNGAFFVNYVITAAFIGTALEISRLPELLAYSVRVLLSRSKAEEPSIRKRTVWEFQFGTGYAWLLCIFSVVVTYSLSCPLITPFGLVYMCFKHLVDRYNLYFAYKPSRISPGIHSTALTFTVWSAVMLQFNFLFFVLIRNTAELDAIVVFMSAVLFLTLLCFVGWIFFGWFTHLPCIQSPYRYVTRETTQEPAPDQLFVASVLRPNQSAQQETASPAGSSINSPSYGSTSLSQSVERLQ